MTRLSFPLWRAGAASRFALALLLAAASLSAGAPLAAPLVARLRAGQGKLASVFMCFASGAPLPGAQTGRPGSASDRGIDCVLCQTLCYGAAPPAARPGCRRAASIQTLNLPWMVADRAAPARRASLSHRPRAPPAMARG